MIRPRSFIHGLLTLIVIAATCIAQSAGAPNQSGAVSEPATSAQAAAQNSAPEADTDSADIPPFARGRISEEQYFALRDQQIRMQRGIYDLVRDPLLRSKAIRGMELQEFFLRQLRESAVPLGLLAPAASNTWTPLGPAPIPNGQTDPNLIAANEAPVSGRVTAIAIDPADTTANTVYVGTAQGGLYRTLDGGSTWTALMDAAQTLAIGAITIDPLNHTTLFLGTGEGNNSGDSFFGVGLYIITNATTTANLSGPFNLNAAGGDVFTGRSITQILVNPLDDNKILVSTGSGFSGVSFDTFSNLPPRGVYLSTNALGLSPTFSRLNVPTGNGNRIVSDMVMEPGNPAKVLVSVAGLGNPGDGGIWVSNSDPFTGTVTWSQALTLGTATGAVVGKFAVNRVSTTTTFMLAASDTASCGASTKAGTLRSSHDGLNWTAIPGATGFCGGQCVYDAPVAIDPNNAGIIYIGGNADSAGTAALSCGSSALAKSIDGTNFNRSDSRLHPDSHAIAIAPSNSSIIYTGNDGGIFKSTDGGATWTSLNSSSFSATQFQSLALHPADANFMIGGTQDNGTEFMNAAAAWTRADFGDGGYSLIDQSSTDTTNVAMYHTYFNVTGSNGLIGFARVTLASNATEGNWDFFGCPASPTDGITANGIACSDNVLFYAPMALGPSLPNTVYFGTDRLYRSPDQGATMTVVSQAPFAINATTGANVPVSAIGISPQNDNVRIVGLTNGQVFATTSGANPMPEASGGLPPHYVARAVIDPTNANTAYVTLDGYGFPSHVWKTTNLNALPPTWVAASGSLPDVPVNAFAIDPLFPNSLYAGTDIGVFNSTDGGTTWVPYGTGLPRVAVFDMAINKVSRKLRIATHGRGIWQIATAQPAGAVALLASNVSPATGAAVTFSASVVQNSSGVAPTGTINFDDGSTVLASVALDASGSASFQTSSLANGTHSVTAAYSGDLNYSPNTSELVLVNVGPPDYILNFSKTSATIAAGQLASFTIEVAPQHGFNAAVSFSCSGLPAGANCSFNPASVTVGGTAASSALSITTTARSIAAAAPPRGWLGFAFLSTGLLGIGLVISGKSGRRRSGPVACLIVTVMMVVGGLIGCGGGGSSSTPPPATGTPAGTYAITVTATSGTTTHQSTVNLTVR
jgi:Big-like domain-containing protein